MKKRKRQQAEKMGPQQKGTQDGKGGEMCFCPHCLLPVMEIQSGKAQKEQSKRRKRTQQRKMFRLAQRFVRCLQE